MNLGSSIILIIQWDGHFYSEKNLEVILCVLCEASLFFLHILGVVQSLLEFSGKKKKLGGDMQIVHYLLP